MDGTEAGVDGVDGGGKRLPEEPGVDNGYDIYTDANYVAWLQEFHPDCVPSLSDMFASVMP